MYDFHSTEEVAVRIMAEPGGKDYGSTYGGSRVLFAAIGHNGCPAGLLHTQAGSGVNGHRLDLYKTPPVELKDKDLFFKVVKAAFGQRRKTLANALSNAGYIGADKEQVRMLLEKTGIEEKQRGETLSIRQFAELSNHLFELL